MEHELLSLTILEKYSKLLLNQSDIENEFLEIAIKQLKDLEHFSHYTSGLWCTDRPDLLTEKQKEKYFWEINFWNDSDKPKHTTE